MYVKTVLTILMVFFLSCVWICLADGEDSTQNTAPFSDWSGTWNCGVNTLNLTQDGTLVSGLYEKPKDMIVLNIEGNVSEDGKTLSGNWSNSGKIEFVLSDDGKTFNGTYISEHMSDIAYNSDSTWNGTLSSEADPENPWSGSWDAGMNTFTNLSQEDNSVQGSYISPGGIPMVIEGTLSEDGKVLTGTYSDSGLFVFTLSEDGNIFNGTFGYGSDSTMRNWNGTRSL